MKYYSDVVVPAPTRPDVMQSIDAAVSGDDSLTDREQQSEQSLNDGDDDRNQRVYTIAENDTWLAVIDKLAETLDDIGLSEDR